MDFDNLTSITEREHQYNLFTRNEHQKILALIEELRKPNISNCISVALPATIGVEAGMFKKVRENRPKSYFEKYEFKKSLGLIEKGWRMLTRTDYVWDEEFS